MGPKKPKKTKAELEEEKLAREEEERKAKIAEDKKQAEEAEKRRIEQLKIEAEHKAARGVELQRLSIEYAEITDEFESKKLQLLAEEKKEVCCAVCRFTMKSIFLKYLLLFLECVD